MQENLQVGLLLALLLMEKGLIIFRSLLFQNHTTVQNWLQDPKFMVVVYVDRFSWSGHGSRD